MKKTLAILTLASCVTAICRAASPAAVPDSLLACRKLQDASERARCYDAQIDKMNAPAVSKSAPAQAAPATPAAAAAPAAPPAPSIPATATAAAKQSSAAKFGEESLPAKARPTAAPKEEALLSSITALNAVAPETYAISLANGQVWRQQQASQMMMFFHVGDDVRIERGALGSYHMSTATAGAKNWVPVTRIQ